MEPCGRQMAGAAALVGRNRFIAPRGASRGAKRRNKVIAPYDSQFASFNFPNALICAVASSALQIVQYPFPFARKRSFVVCEARGLEPVDVAECRPSCGGLG